MNQPFKGKGVKQISKANILESLKDIGTSTGDTIKKDLLGDSAEEFFRQLLGTPKPEKHSGEINPGESVELNNIYSGQRESEEKLQTQIRLERNLSQEQNSLTEKKMNELRIQLHALTQEIYELAKITQNLGQEVEVAAMQAPANPGIYHLNFFEKLLSFIRNFRKNIQSAEVWLTATNDRAEKKNFWSSFKKQGTKFYLSSEHYLQRSAG